jgi:hypothetical protein
VVLKGGGVVFFSIYAYFSFRKVHAAACSAIDISVIIVDYLFNTHVISSAGMLLLLVFSLLKYKSRVIIESQAFVID